MTTKELIIEEALTLFSQKGYHGTSVKDIANAVGIKDSSLYKHFSSKQEIFDIIVCTMENKMEKMSLEMGLPPDNNFTSAASYYGSLTKEGLLALSRQVFLFYLKDPFVARFRKMAIIEQYNQENIYRVYHRIFLESSIFYLTALFQEMIAQHIFVAVDACILAMNFYTPIFFLLCKYDQTPDLEAQAIECLDKQIGEFYRIYRICE